MRRSLPCRLLALTSSAILTPIIAVGVTSAAASTTFPSNGKLAATTAHTFTVQVKATPGARSYVVSASTNIKQMTVAALRADPHHTSHYSAGSRSTTITVDVGHFTSKPLYYRVAAIQASNGNDAWAPTVSSAFGLRPSTPTGLKQHSGSDGEFLVWTSSSNGSYIQQATNSAFTSGVKSYRIRAVTHRFTPYGLTVGRTYWFRVRAMNVHSYSTASASVSLVAKAREQHVRVMSYNLLEADLDGQAEGGQTVAPWAQRVKVAAQLVTRTKPDVLVLQESFSILGHSAYGTTKYPNWTIPARNPCNANHYADPRHYPYRQVDSLCDALGHGQVYRRALDGTANHNGSGDNLLYNHLTTALVGHGGFWDIGYNRKAGWQEFETLTNKVKYLVVTPHTTPRVGAAYDKQRASEVRSLIAQAKREAAARGISRVIYGGDFNTYPGRAGSADPTSPIMRADGYTDVVQAAQTLTNAQYNSESQYLRRPLTGGHDVDHIFTTHGIGVQRYGKVLNVSHGAFVGTIPSDHNPIYADLTLPY